MAEKERKEVLRRDKWQCQGENCVAEKVYGTRIEWGNQFNVQAAHYPEKHKPYIDKDIDNARCLCLSCHIIEEIQRNNHKGVQLLYEGHTFRNRDWLQENGWRDQRMSLQWYYDVAFYMEKGDIPAVEGLICAAQDYFGLG